MGPEEDRAGVGDFVAERLWVVRHDLEMLRRQPIDKRERSLERRTENDGAMSRQLALAILARGRLSS